MKGLIQEIESHISVTLVQPVRREIVQQINIVKDEYLSIKEYTLYRNVQEGKYLEVQ